jgi:hypothetical protein
MNVSLIQCPVPGCQNDLDNCEACGAQYCLEHDFKAKTGCPLESADCPVQLRMDAREAFRPKAQGR